MLRVVVGTGDVIYSYHQNLKINLGICCCRKFQEKKIPGCFLPPPPTTVFAFDFCMFKSLEEICGALGNKLVTVRMEMHSQTEKSKQILVTN